jgi:hypothetical protein
MEWGKWVIGNWFDMFEANWGFSWGYAAALKNICYDKEFCASRFHK